jgi:hypothetical protein
MRSFTIHTVTNGREEYHSTVHNAREGKEAHEALKRQGGADYLRCRDCLGGLRFEYNLRTGKKTA